MEDGEISIADANHKLPVKEKMIKVSPQKDANEFKAVSYIVEINIKIKLFIMQAFIILRILNNSVV